MTFRVFCYREVILFLNHTVAQWPQRLTPDRLCNASRKELDTKVNQSSFKRSGSCYWALIPKFSSSLTLWQLQNSPKPSLLLLENDTVTARTLQDVMRTVGRWVKLCSGPGSSMGWPWLQGSCTKYSQLSLTAGSTSMDSVNWGSKIFEKNNSRKFQ